MYFFDLEDYATTYREGESININKRIPIHFNCTTYYNGKQSWISDDSALRIIWDPSLSTPAWRVSGATEGGIQLINTNPASPPVNGNWVSIGQSYTVTASLGACPVADELVMTTSVTKPTCTCNGTITVQASGGYPPYSYSLSPVASTYRSSPFFTNVCGVLGGIITVYVRDTFGTVVSQTVNVGEGGQAIAYSISTNIVSNELVSSNPTTKYASYKTVHNLTVVDDSKLTSSSVVTFDLTISGKFRRSPFQQTATSTLTHTVTKNGVTISTFTNNDTETNVPGTGSLTSCAAYSSWYTNYSRTYSSMTYQKGDVIVITSYFDVTPNCSYKPPVNAQLNFEDGNIDGGDSLGPLTYGQKASFTYLNCCVYNWEVQPYIQVDNPKITGCNCCTIQSVSYTKSLYE